VKRWYKHLTAVSDGWLRGAHARNLLPIELHTNFTPVRYGEAMFHGNFVNIGP